jgi:hypothetical protein
MVALPALLAAMQVVGMLMLMAGWDCVAARPTTTLMAKEVLAALLSSVAADEAPTAVLDNPHLLLALVGAGERATLTRYRQLVLAAVLVVTVAS